MKKEGRKGLILNILLITGAIAFAILPPYDFNHYYLPFIVIFFYSLAFFIHFEKQFYKGSGFIIYILLFYSLSKLDDNQQFSFKTSFIPYQPDRITEILTQDKSKTLFIDQTDASKYYIYGEKSFPTFMAVPIAFHFNETRQGLINRKRIYEELKKNKPDFLIIGESSSYMYWHVPDPLLYYGNYVIIDSTLASSGQQLFLWKLKDGHR